MCILYSVYGPYITHNAVIISSDISRLFFRAGMNTTVMRPANITPQTANPTLPYNQVFLEHYMYYIYYSLVLFLYRGKICN